MAVDEHDAEALRLTSNAANKENDEDEKARPSDLAMNALTKRHLASGRGSRAPSLRLQLS